MLRHRRRRRQWQVVVVAVAITELPRDKNKVEVGLEARVRIYSVMFGNNGRWNVSRDVDGGRSLGWGGVNIQTNGGRMTDALMMRQITFLIDPNKTNKTALCILM